jgi:hypothetical protein
MNAHSDLPALIERFSTEQLIPPLNIRQPFTISGSFQSVATIQKRRHLVGKRPVAEVVRTAAFVAPPVQNLPVFFRPSYAEIIQHVDPFDPRTSLFRNENAGGHLEGR